MSPRSILARRRDRSSTTASRAARPRLEGLEERFLLYATSGSSWPNPIRISYSFMPDGTAVGGNPNSSLFATMNQFFPTATWEATLEKAAASWENVANVNLALVPDNGAAYASSGDLQGDPNFGDIRIGAIPLGSGTAAMAILPPPGTTGTAAGDIFFNSTLNWGTSGSYQVDLMTVALHELGHALGMEHSADSTAVMYQYYSGPNQSLQSDDAAGIQSIYGAPPADTQGNQSLATALDITPNIANNQIALGGQYLSNFTDQHWYKVVVPSTTTGTMTVTQQTTNLSSLAPRVRIFGYNPTYNNWSALAQAFSSNLGGSTVSTTVNVAPGQTYYISAGSTVSGPGCYGAFGIEVNFGSSSQAPIAPPNTVVLPPPTYTAAVAYDTYETSPAPHRHQSHHLQSLRHLHTLDHALATWEASRSR